MNIGDLTAWQWFGAAASALLVGLSKAGFGSGAAILAVPLMAAALGPATMLAVMLLVLIIGDVFSIVHYLDKHDRRNLAMLIPGLVLGIGVGYLTLGWFLGLRDGDLWMKRLIGLSCAAFVLVQFYRMAREARAGATAAPYRPAVWHGVGLGAVAGVTSTLAHAGGPIIDLFLLPQKLEKRVFVGTVIKYFFVGNLIKLVPYAQTGLMTGQVVLVSVALLPCVVVGTLSGVCLNKRFSDRSFRIVVYSLAFVMGLYLLSGWEPWSSQGASRQKPQRPSARADAQDAFRAGLAAYARGDYRAAAAGFREGAAGAPWEDRARLNLALVSYEVKRYEEAAAALEPLGASADSMVRLHAGFSRGNSAYRLGRFARAADWYLLTARACRAELGVSKTAADADAVRELLRRAGHNLALASARNAAPAQSSAQGGSAASQPRAGLADEGAAETATEGQAGARPPGPVHHVTGNAPGSEGGTRDVDALLSSVASRDSGPVLKGRSVRVLSGGRNW